MHNPTHADLTIANHIIDAAEHDLGILSRGQLRDLLLDNTDWSPELVREIVLIIRGKD